MSSATAEWTPCTAVASCRPGSEDLLPSGSQPAGSGRRATPLTRATRGRPSSRRGSGPSGASAAPNTAPATAARSVVTTTRRRVPCFGEPGVSLTGSHRRRRTPARTPSRRTPVPERAPVLRVGPEAVVRTLAGTAAARPARPARRAPDSGRAPDSRRGPAGAPSRGRPALPVLSTSSASAPGWRAEPEAPARSPVGTSAGLGTAPERAPAPAAPQLSSTVPPPARRPLRRRRSRAVPPERPRRAAAGPRSSGSSPRPDRGPCHAGSQETGRELPGTTHASRREGGPPARITIRTYLPM